MTNKLEWLGVVALMVVVSAIILLSSLEDKRYSMERVDITSSGLMAGKVPVQCRDIVERRIGPPTNKRVRISVDKYREMIKELTWCVAQTEATGVPRGE